MNDLDNILTGSQIEAYRRDGFTVVRSVFKQHEIEKWRFECERVWSDLVAGDSVSRIQDRGYGNGEMIADRLDPLLDISPLFDEFAHRDPRVQIACEKILNARVNVFKGKVIMKRPGTHGYGLHQDYPYWGSTGVSADHFVIVVIPLDQCDVESGAMEVFPGLQGGRVPSPPGHPLDADETEIDLNSGVLLDMEPGDMALLHSMTPHRSGPNNAGRNRTVLYFTYNLADYGKLQENYYAQRPDKDLFR